MRCFSCTKIHDRVDQKLFLEGSRNVRQSAFSGTFSSPHTFCTPPCHGPTISGLRPEISKKSPKNRFWPHRENREKIAPKKGKMAQRSVVGPFFQFWGDFSPIFRVRPKSIFQRFLSVFGPEARKRPSPMHAYSHFCRDTLGKIMPFSWHKSVYHPPENFRSQDKMFLELISLCKCNFSSFHNYLFMQVQVGVLLELFLKQVVMQVPFRLFQDYGVLH